MALEDKELLLKDLCARLPYGFTVRRYSDNRDITFGKNELDEFSHFLEYSEGKEFKPYLRQMSSMTEEEVDELIAILNKQCTERVISKDNFELTSFGTLWFTNMKEYECVSVQLMAVVIDYCNANHFDYRGLIPMGLALEAPEGMYEKF